MINKSNNVVPTAAASHAMVLMALCLFIEQRIWRQWHIGISRNIFHEFWTGVENARSVRVAFAGVRVEHDVEVTHLVPTRHPETTTITAFFVCVFFLSFDRGFIKNILSSETLQWLYWHFNHG